MTWLEAEGKSQRPSWRLIAASLLHSLIGVSSVYFVTAVSVPQTVLQNFTNNSIYAHYNVVLDQGQLDWVWSAVVCFLILGSMAGGPFLGWAVVHFGSRNTCLIWHNALTIAACVFHLIAFPTNCFELIAVGRFLAGLAIPITYWTGIFLTECAPVNCRGIVSAPTATGKSAWCVVGAAMGLETALGSSENLMYLMAVPIIPAVLHICCTPFIPKSPKELFITEGDEKRAIIAIQFYHGEDADVDEVLDEFRRESELAKSVHDVTLRDIFRHKHLYMPFLVINAVYLGYAFGGGDAVAFYSVHILTRSGLAWGATEVAVYGQIPAVVISLFCMVAVRAWGRRPVSLTSFVLGVCATLSFLIGLCSADASSTVGSVFGVLGLVCSMGSVHSNEMVASILPGEICPLGSRALSTAWASTLSWFFSLVTSLTYLPIESRIGGWTFSYFFVIDVCLLIFLFIYLPETKGLPVDKILEPWIDTQETKPLLSDAAKIYGSDEPSETFD